MEKINAEPATAQLLALLGNKDRSIRETAARILSQEKVQMAIPKLLGLLHDKDERIRGNAISYLGQSNAQVAVPRLLSYLGEGFFLGGYFVLPETLGKLNAQAAIPGILNQLDLPFPEIKGITAETLGRLQAQAAVPALLKMLVGKDGEAQQSAALALSRMHVQDPALAQWQNQRLAELHESIQTNPDNKAKTAESLAFVVNPAAVATLGGWLDDSDTEVLVASLNALASIAAVQPQWLEAHLAHFIELAHHNDANVQKAAASALAAMAIPSAKPSDQVQAAFADKVGQALADLARDSTLPDNVRLVALDGLGGSKSIAAAQVLWALLQDPQQSNS